MSTSRQWENLSYQTAALRYEVVALSSARVPGRLRAAPGFLIARVALILPGVGARAGTIGGFCLPARGLTVPRLIAFACLDVASFLGLCSAPDAGPIYI